MITEDQNLRLQQVHPLVATSGFASIEEYVNFLIHRRAYEEAASMAQHKTVLDWGCNNGYGIGVMRSLGCGEISGIDLNSQAIASARERLGNDVELILFDGKRAPLPSDQFDVITSFQCIEHVVDHADYLSEIRRLLTPDGVAIFTTPNATIRLDPGMKPWNEFHVLEFRPSELKDLLSEHFSMVTIQGLFGKTELHRIEVERCERARHEARSTAVSKPEPRPRPIYNAIRQLTPTPVVQFVKGLVPSPKPPILPEHSTSEFYYKQTELDSALDLMAICRK